MSSAAGQHVSALTVPDGYLYLITWYHRALTSANSTVSIETAEGAQENMTPGATSADKDQAFWLMSPGDSIGMTSTGAGGDSSRGFTVSGIALPVDYDPITQKPT